MLERTRIELESERRNELFSELSHEPEIHEFLIAYLEAKADPDDERAQCLALSYLLAEVIENPFTPERIRDEIADGLSQIEGDFQGGVLERQLRAGCLVPAMIHAATKDAIEEVKPNGKA